jgi:glycosyltransferase involved in cell wall biosynthesis
MGFRRLRLLRTSRLARPAQQPSRPRLRFLAYHKSTGGPEVTISTIIPTFNRRVLAMRAIDSVLAQTVPLDEIIVVDDGSTDDTCAAIRARYGSRVRLLRQANAGAAAARNRGIREARGAWIAFLDSDDAWLPTKIDRQQQALAALGPDLGFCFTDCVYDGNPERRSSIFREVGLAEAPRYARLAEPAACIFASNEPFYTPSVLVQRQLLTSIGGFDEGLTIGEDTDVFFRLSFRTSFCFVAEPLVQIDRTPSRTVGLCDLYLARDDRKYDCLDRLYGNWLAMPEVAGTKYEQPVRDMLRLLRYSSAECKLHQMRIGSALRELGRLRALGEGYPAIALNLLLRKADKFRRKLRHGAGEKPRGDSAGCGPS